MKILNAFGFVFIMSLSNDCLGNDCSKQSKSEIYSDSDLVFIGYVIESNDINYKVLVEEIFKGSPSDTLIGIVDKNFVHPQKGSNWLFYISGFNNENIYFDFCSGSKSFEFPYGFHDISRLIPPSKEFASSPKDLTYLELLQSIRSSNEMYYEINTLRSLKSKEDITKLLKEIENLKSEKSRTFDPFISILILSFSVLQLALIVILLKKLKR